MLCFAAVHYYQYKQYLTRTPIVANQLLTQAIVEMIMATVFIYICVLFYRNALAIHKAATIGRSDEEYETAFRINLRILKIQCLMFIASILYYGFVLVRTVNKLG